VYIYTCVQYWTSLFTATLQKIEEKLYLLQWFGQNIFTNLVISANNLRLYKSQTEDMLQSSLKLQINQTCSLNCKTFLI
jgi:hypothetical protein